MTGTPRKTQRPPSHLSKDGKRRWRSIASDYELRPDELITLEDIYVKSDRIVELTTEWDALGRPEMTKGSMGQQVEHPIPARIERLRMERNALLAKLKLPDLESSAAETNKHREAAQSRWQTTRDPGKWTYGK